MTERQMTDEQIALDAIGYDLVLTNAHEEEAIGFPADDWKARQEHLAIDLDAIVQNIFELFETLPLQRSRTLLAELKELTEEKEQSLDPADIPAAEKRIFILATSLPCDRVLAALEELRESIADDECDRARPLDDEDE
jgi:PHD/YefM family antitoxin component YafN of YafNO toxin-antitoxin module